MKKLKLLSIAIALIYAPLPISAQASISGGHWLRDEGTKFIVAYPNAKKLSVSDHDNVNWIMGGGDWPDGRGSTGAGSSNQNVSIQNTDFIAAIAGSGANKHSNNVANNNILEINFGSNNQRQQIFAVSGLSISFLGDSAKTEANENTLTISGKLDSGSQNVAVISGLSGTFPSEHLGSNDLTSAQANNNNLTFKEANLKLGSPNNDDYSTIASGFVGVPVEHAETAEVKDNTLSFVDSNIETGVDSPVAAARFVVDCGPDYQGTAGKNNVINNGLILRNSTINSPAGVYAGSYDTENIDIADPDNPIEINSREVENILNSIGVNKTNYVRASGVNTIKGGLYGWERMELQISEENLNKPIITLQSSPLYEENGVAIANSEHGGTLDMKNRSVTVSAYGNYQPEQGKDYLLVQAESIENFEAQPVEVETTFLNYDATVVQEGNMLVLESEAIQSARPNANSKTVAEAVLGSAAFVSQGAEFIADEGLNALSLAVPAGTSASFAAVHGGANRYETGSHITVKGVSMAVGAGTNVGNATIGAFFEAGYADSDSNVSGTKGDGDHSYYGAGLIGKYKFTPSWYADASWRIGGTKTKFKGDFATSRAHYTSDSLYTSAHVGTGIVANVNEITSVDVYGRYTFSFVDGDTVKLHSDATSKLKFKSNKTHAARVGIRLRSNPKPTISWKAGLAYEHTFNGDAKSYLNEVALDVPSLEGDTGIAELGINIRPSAESPWEVDLGLKGYVGDRQGVYGNALVRYLF